jgi:hypothetical protein
MTTKVKPYKERRCVLCNCNLKLEHCLETQFKNQKIKNKELIKEVWEREEIKLFCCFCFKRITNLQHYDEEFSGSVKTNSKADETIKILKSVIRNFSIKRVGLSLIGDTTIDLMVEKLKLLMNLDLIGIKELDIVASIGFLPEEMKRIIKKIKRWLNEDNNNKTLEKGDKQD